MKKVLFVLAFVAVYGVSLAMTEATVVANDEIVQVVNDVDKVEKEKKDKAAKAEAKSEGCSGTKAKADGCSSKADGCSSKAKADGCSGEKTAKKSDCSKSCGGK